MLTLSLSKLYCGKSVYLCSLRKVHQNKGKRVTESLDFQNFQGEHAPGPPHTNRAKGPSYLPMMYTILPIKICINIPTGVTSNPCFDFFPFGVALSNFEYPKTED